MSITFQPFAMKDLSAIEIMKVDNLTDTADWLELNLPAGSTVNRSIINYGTLVYTTPDERNYSVQIGNNLAVDANGKIFKLDQTLVDAFYDLVP